MAVRRENYSTITSGEEADAFVKDRDGYLGEAMRSYGFYTRDASAMTKQVQEIIAKVKAGEYQTEEECIAAFRAHVGGGAASELYKSLEHLPKVNGKPTSLALRQSLNKRPMKPLLETWQTHRDLKRHQMRPCRKPIKMRSVVKTIP